MTPIGWATIFFQTIAFAAIVVGAWIKMTNKIAAIEAEKNMLKDEIKRVNYELKSHCGLNEGAFSNIEKDIKGINSKLDELLGYFKATNKMPL